MSRASCRRRIEQSCAPTPACEKKLIPGTVATPTSFASQIANSLARDRKDLREVRQYIVGALGSGVLESRLVQRRAHDVPPRTVLEREMVVVVVSNAIPIAPAACSGAGAPTVRKSWTLRIAYVNSAGRRNRVPEPPPRQLKVFDNPEMVTVRSRIPGQRRQHVVPARVPDVLVDLVGDRDHVVLLTELGDQRDLFARKDRPVGLCGVFTMIARVLVRERARSSSDRTSSRAPPAARTRGVARRGSRPARSSRRTARRRSPRRPDR